MLYHLFIINIIMQSVAINLCIIYRCVHVNLQSSGSDFEILLIDRALQANIAILNIESSRHIKMLDI